MTAAQKRLASLRALMRERGQAAYIVYSADAHQSEYVTKYWQARAWVSGFTGSAGLLVVTMERAGLWTDGRYFIQAANQLDGSGIDLFRMSVEGVPTYSEWLKHQLCDGQTVGVDGRAVPVAEYERLQREMDGKGIRFDYREDLVGLLWADRPGLPHCSVFNHELSYAGKTRSEKLSQVREAMRKKGAAYHLIVSLDDIAWLLNMRGCDIPNTPVAYCYCLVTLQEVHLFIDAGKISDMRSFLVKDGVTLHDYEMIEEFVSSLHNGEGKLWYDANRVSVRLSEAIPKGIGIVKGGDATLLLKAVKNPVEIENIRKTHIKDGVAMVKFLRWLEETVASGTDLHESDIDAIITGLRKEQSDCLGPSFDTIAAYMENAASMHYKPVHGADKKIEESGFLLVDSGGQYLGGTTDITRTIMMGELTHEMIHDFTLVLRGHIALASAKFLSGTTGPHLDVLARMPLWHVGIDYKSGTGHGIGYCLGVHEGPQSISQRQNDTKLEPGMLLTNEPGVYKEGRYGIRTENMMVVSEAGQTGDGSFLCFELISFCPIDVRAIDTAMLSADEINFINNYHQKTYDVLHHYLQDNERAWLRKATNPI